MQISLISDVAENLNLSMHVISICVTNSYMTVKTKRTQGVFLQDAVIFTQVTLVFSVLKL